MKHSLLLENNNASLKEPESSRNGCDATIWVLARLDPLFDLHPGLLGCSTNSPLVSSGRLMSRKGPATSIEPGGLSFRKRRSSIRAGKLLCVQGEGLPKDRFAMMVNVEDQRAEFGLDPIRWTPKERGIWCRRWIGWDGRSEHGAASQPSSRPVRSRWFSTKGGRSLRSLEISTSLRRRSASGWSRRVRIAAMGRQVRALGKRGPPKGAAARLAHAPSLSPTATARLIGSLSGSARVVPIRDPQVDFVH